MTTPARSGLPVAGGRVTLQAVLVLLRGRRWRFVGSLALIAAAAASAIVLPLTIGSLVDTVADAGGDEIPAVFAWQVGALVAAAVGGGLLEAAGVLVLGRLVQQMTAELREGYVAAALRLPDEDVERLGAGDLVTRAATDTRVLSDELPAILSTVVAAGFSVVMIVVGTTVVDLRFLLVFALVAPLYALALRWYLPAVPPVYAALRAADSVRGERILTAMSALPTVVAFGDAERQADGIRAATWNVARWEVRARIMQNRFFGRIHVAEVAGLLGVLACGFALAAYADASLGQVTAAVLLFLQLTAPLGALLFVMDEVQSAVAALARVVGVIRLAPASGAPVDGGRPPLGEPALTVHDVSYSYRAGHPVLRGIALHVAQGEHLAIVGSSGSGKTTLARLIAGSREPDSGTIATSVAPNRIVALSQESHVFAATLRDNLLLAAPAASDEELVEVLRAVHAGSLLDLPGGLAAVLGEEGHRLTGAESQLLALARLVLRDPELAILDEATADADSRSAAHLAHATAVALRGRTAIVIAHQLDQARRCDRIVVLDRGRIVEQGTHDELISADGRYAHVWQRFRPSGNPEL